VRCARTLDDVINKLTSMSIPRAPSLRPLCASSPTRDAEIFTQIKNDAEYDTEYTSVLSAAVEGESR
jgi:hypothetical protein